MTTTSRNGAAENTGTAGDAGQQTRGAEAAAGRESGEERVGREGGVALFGNGEKGHEALKNRLMGLMGEPPPSREERAARALEDQGVERDEETAEGDTHEPLTGEESTEGSEEQLEEQETAEEAEEAEGATEEESRQWPKPAVAEIAKLRKARREAREEAERLREETAELRGRVESAELKRPVAPTRESPLEFASNEEELSDWEERAGAWVDLAEEALEPDGEIAPELVSWAQQNKAWDAENQAIDRGQLRRRLREARVGLSKHAPERREFLRVRAFAEAKFTRDPVLAPMWKDKESQEYKDAIEVIKTVPGVRQLPHVRAAAAIYALGLKEYRRQLALKGGAAGAAGGPKKLLPAPKAAIGSVRGPGRAVVLPRNAPPSAVPGQQARDRVRKPGATTNDYVDYARQALAGKIGAPRE
jgi:hypothetical protein